MLAMCPADRNVGSNKENARGPPPFSGKGKGGAPGRSLYLNRNVLREGRTNPGLSRASQKNKEHKKSSINFRILTLVTLKWLLGFSDAHPFFWAPFRIVTTRKTRKYTSTTNDKNVVLRRGPFL